LEIASTLVNVFIVLVMGGFLNYMMRDRFARLERELAEVKGDVARLQGRMDAGFESVRSEFTAIRSEFRSELQAVRSDLTAVALAVRGESASPTREAGQP
jgi:hypothetical protein